MFSSIVNLQVLHACSRDVLRTATVCVCALAVCRCCLMFSSTVGGVSLQVLLDVFKYFETA